MKIIPDNFEHDAYFGKGVGYLSIFLFIIVAIILAVFYGIFTKISSIGELGAFLSGTIGTLVALLVAIFTFLAFYAQYDANKKIQKQFWHQQSSDQFYTMLNLHNKNVEDFRINSFQSNVKQIRYELEIKGQRKENKVDLKSIISKTLLADHDAVRFNVRKDYEEHFNPIRSVVDGRRCFLLMIKDLHFTIHCVNKINQSYQVKLDSDDELDLAYRFFFWGTNSRHTNFGDAAKNKVSLNIKDKLNELKLLIRNNAYGDKITFDYETTNGKFGTNQSIQDHIRFIPISGHSTRLAHYFRHLYQTVKQIHVDVKNKNISKQSGLRFLNTLRAQMSNQEQLLLYYNYRIGFGGKWDKRYDRDKDNRGEYEFLTTYKMIHNIPLYNSIHENVEHPEDHFKEFLDLNPTFDLFEWS